MKPSTDDLASSIRSDSSRVQPKLQEQASSPLHGQSASSAVRRRNEAHLPPLTVVPGGKDAEWLQAFPLIVHSHLRWDFVWQRPQQILSRLAEHHPILFIEEPIGTDGAARLELSEPQANIVRAIQNVRKTGLPA